MKEIKNENQARSRESYGNAKAGTDSRNLPSTKCLACRAGFSYLLMRRRLGDSKSNIERTAVGVCRLMTSYPDEVCTGIVKLNIDSVIFIIDSRPKLTATSICALIMQGECGPLDSSLDFKLKISPGSEITQSKSVSNNVNKIKVLHISDIHYDPNYLVGGNAKCGQPCCCRMKQGLAKNEHDKAGNEIDFKIKVNKKRMKFIQDFMVIIESVMCLGIL